MAYAELAQLKAMLSMKEGEGDQALLILLLDAVSAFIDSYTKQAPNGFAGVVAASPKIVYGSDSHILRLPFHQPMSVESVVAPSGVDVPDYIEREGDRTCDLYTLDENYKLTQFIVWRAGMPYTVRAKWGYANIPADIRLACLQTCVRLFRSKDEGFSGVIGSMKSDGTIIERSLPANAKMILDQYRNMRRRFYIA